MKRRQLKALLALPLFLAAALPVSAELKLGYIDSEVIFQRYEGTQDAQKALDKQVAAWEQEASERQKEIREIKEQLEKQSLLLSPERKRDLERKLEEKMVEYQKFLAEKFGQDGEALKRNAELTKPIVERINKIIEDIAQKEKYDFILDTRAGGVVFAQEGYNLTERVLTQLNKQ